MIYNSLPTVSVIIPVFNGERFVGDAIRSALDQTFRDIELVVIDDGSTDQTAKVVRQFSGPISYHRQENRGAGAARNLGVILAKGEWIAFLDADDEWYPEKLSAQLELTSANINQLPFIYSDMDVIDVHGSVIRKGVLSAKNKRRRNRFDLVALAFQGKVFPFPSTVLMKRDLFLNTGGFCAEFRRNYHEDFDLFARIAQIAPIHFMEQSLVKYRQGKKSNVAEAISQENWLILLRRLADLWHDDAERSNVVKWLVDKDHSDRGKRYLRSGDWVKARECFQQVFWRRPFYWRNLQRWGLSYIPGARELYGRRKSRISSERTD